MNKTLKSLFLLLSCVVMGFSAYAQGDPMATVLPSDPSVRIGKLPNGLTYYIRHNEKPKGQADFYIAQKVGSILEEDNQRGLAHFLEHMCFNGTKNFPGNSIVEWCEKNGIKFGANLNAYTGIDQTVYNISNAPIARVGVQDSVLLILHDWADALLLEPEEIDKERGVIHQEWRRSNVGQQRTIEKLLPKLYQEEKYGYRLPIGTMEVVDNFPPQALRDYYETWYRPDQQGIIVVGDIDVDRIEGKIKELFGSIQMPENPKKREYLPVSDNKGTIYAIGADPENPMLMAQLMFKTEAMPDSINNTVGSFVQNMLYKIIDMMLNQRLEDISSRPDAPFSVAQVSIGDFLISGTKDALTLTVVPKGDDLEGALKAAYREVLRATRGGFTQGEFERAISEYKSQIEQKYNNRDQRENEEFVQTYLNNFLHNKYMMPIEMEYQVAQQMASMLPLEAFNSILPDIVTADNRVAMVMVPEKEGYTVPTEEQLSGALASVDGETIEAFVDEVKAEPLIAEMPKPGTIKEVSFDDTWQAQVWTLSNGVKVVVKPTTFKNDEILFTAIAKGQGLATLPDNQANSIIAMPYLMSEHGLGSYTSSDLKKYLQGKQASVDLSIGIYDREVSGATTVKDLPTLMELIYMTFVDFQLNPDEFAATQQTFVNVLQNQQSTPQFTFQRTILESLMDSPKARMISADAIAAADRDFIVNTAKAATANAADYTFFFVGNVDPDALKPLVEQYIASLPANAKKASTKVKLDPSMEVKSGKGEHHSTMKMETPQAWVNVVVEGTMPYNMRNQKMASIVPQILSARLIKTVREDEGAVYSIGAHGSMDEIAAYPISFQIPFPLDPDKTRLVLGMIDKEIQDMTTNITDEELNKVKEYLVKAYTENLEKNSAWLRSMKSNALTGVDVMHGNIDFVNSVTKEDVAKWMKELINQGNYQVVILEPEK